MSGFKRALAELEDVSEQIETCEECYLDASKLRQVRSALEAAAREAADWAAIEAWWNVDPHRREFCLERDIHAAIAGYPWQFILTWKSQEVFECKTRLEAAWCRAEMAK